MRDVNKRYIKKRERYRDRGETDRKKREGDTDGDRDREAERQKERERHRERPKLIHYDDRAGGRGREIGACVGKLLWVYTEDRRVRE